MAKDATYVRQRRLVQLLDLRDQMYGLEDAWTKHIGIIDKRMHRNTIENHEHAADISKHEQAPNLRISRITPFMPLDESQLIVSDRIRFYSWRINVLRLLKVPIDPDMDIDADEELARQSALFRSAGAGVSREQDGLLKLQAKIDEREHIVGILEADQTKAIERLRLSTEECIEIEEDKALEASVALDLFHRTRAMGLCVRGDA